MKKAAFTLCYLLYGGVLFAQWTTSGNNIYNSNTGSVGIGTNSPTSQLSVNGNSDIPLGSFFGSTLGDKFLYESKQTPNYGMQWVFDSVFSGAPYLWLSGYGGFKFFTTSQPRMTIDANGNVGVGTISPPDRISVVTTGTGGMRVTANTSGNSIFSNGHALECLSSNFTGGLAISVGANNSGFIQAFSSTTENGNILLDPNGGNVLIGKKNQVNTTYSLDVAGNVRANEMVVNTTGADFVFDPGYSLAPLRSVGQYVRDFHHLPGIAPAAQMQKEGAAIGDLSTHLLQKVEELTLYAVDADKRLAAQDSLIVSQQTLLLQLQSEMKAQQVEIDRLKTQQATRP